MARLKMPPDDQLMQWVEATEHLKNAGHQCELRRTDKGQFSLIIGDETVIDNIRDYDEYLPVGMADDYIQAVKQEQQVIDDYRAILKQRAPQAQLVDGDPDPSLTHTKSLFLFGLEATIATIYIPLEPDFIEDYEYETVYVRADGGWVTDDDYPSTKFLQHLTECRRQLIRNLAKLTGKMAGWAETSLPADRYMGLRKAEEHYRQLGER